jgi:exonuclease SbcC
MKINFKSITLHNFFSFSDATINLENRGYSIVTGENNNAEDLAMSNGSGKSSIWEGIVWTLTGNTIRGCKDVKNNRLDDGVYTILNFNIDNIDYKIIRSKGSKEYKTGVFFYVNDENKSGKGVRDTDKIISEYLPDLTSELIGSVIILGQGLPQKFTNNTPAGRKEVLETLTKSDFMINEIKDKIESRKNELSEYINAKKSDLISTNTRLDSLESSLRKIKSKLEELENPDIYQKQLDECQESLSKKTSELNNNKDKINELRQTIENIYTEINNLVEKSNSIEKEIRNKYNNQLENLDKIVKEKNVEKQVLSKQINQINSIKDICPTCGQKIEKVHKPDIAPLIEQLTQTEKDLDALISEQYKLTATCNNEIASCTEELNASINNLKTNKDNHIKEQSRLEPLIDELNSDITNLKLKEQELITTLENYAQLKLSLEKDITSITSEIEKIDKERLYINNDIEVLQLRLNAINKLNTLVSRDFRGYLLSNVIEFINAKIKEYCNLIFENSSLDFTLDGNNIRISYCNKEYENLSGGEKQKVDIIIQFAIRDMLSTFSNFSSNILVLDEIFDSLDNIGCQKIINIISNKLSDIESIFIITHRGDLSIPYDTSIKVIKDSKGLSYIK